MHPFTSNTGQKLLQKPLETFKRIVFTYTKEGRYVFARPMIVIKENTMGSYVGNLLGLFDKIG
jgi:hypothetical protein